MRRYYEESTEFRKIYLSERGKYTSFFSDYDSGSYGRSSQTEYFAEAFHISK